MTTHVVPSHGPQPRAIRRAPDPDDHAPKIGRTRSRVAAFAMAFATTVMVMPSAHAAPETLPKEMEPPAKSVKKTGKKREPSGGGPGGWATVPTTTWPERPMRAPTEVAIAAAREQLGKPYRWGSEGPNSFDCSGLTMYAYGRAGVSLPHNSGSQYGSVERVPLDELRRGDLVFSGGGHIHHVGIYIGDGKMIHAPQSGDHVKISPLRSNLIGAGRPA